MNDYSANEIELFKFLKTSNLVSDFDLLHSFMEIPEDQARLMIGRRKLQDLENIRTQIIANNPGMIIDTGMDEQI